MTKDYTKGIIYLSPVSEKINLGSGPSEYDTPDSNTESPPESCTARMSSDSDAVEYNMRHKNRGLALIFNHENFDVPTLVSRTGTNVDCENLTKVLKKLNFDVNVFNDCSLNELKHHVERASQKDHSENDCILVAILSHGEHGYLYAKDVLYKLELIFSYFTPQNCPSLAGKPKLFLIQACQGVRYDPGVTLNRRIETDDATSMSNKIPSHADFLIANSTMQGLCSTRGSWFIHALCSELESKGEDLDILTLLTFVCRRVAIGCETDYVEIPEMHEQKQMPCITSMLTRILHFGKRQEIQ